MAFAQLEGTTNMIFKHLALYTAFLFAGTQAMAETMATTTTAPTTRSLDAAFMLGLQQPTQEAGDYLSTGTTPGISVSYFVNKDLAFEATYTRSNNTLSIPVAKIAGKTSQSTFAAHMKYYIPTVADTLYVTPYIVGGFSQSYRQFSINGTSADSMDSALAAEAGIGIEAPIFQSYFAGFQALFRSINYPGDHQFMRDANNTITNARLQGDQWNFFFVLGMSL